MTMTNPNPPMGGRETRGDAEANAFRAGWRATETGLHDHPDGLEAAVAMYLRGDHNFGDEELGEDFTRPAQARSDAARIAELEAECKASMETIAIEHERAADAEDRVAALETDTTLSERTARLVALARELMADTRSVDRWEAFTNALVKTNIAASIIELADRGKAS